MDKPQIAKNENGLVPWIQRRGATRITIGAVMIGIMVALAIVSIWYTPYDPNVTDLKARLVSPNLTHWFGTDNLGRDIFSRIMAGGRISLSIAGLAIVGTAIIGSVLGLLSGYYGGLTDHVSNMLAEMQSSIPMMLLIIIFLSVFGPSVLTVAIVLAIADWVGIFRTVRSRTLVEKKQDYVTAGRAMGAKNLWIIFKHLLPNILPTITVMATLIIGAVIISEANLSYLGVGVARPFPSWGRMISDGQAYLSSAWWISFFPALAITISVIGINLLGDGLRQMLKME